MEGKRKTGAGPAKPRLQSFNCVTARCLALVLILLAGTDGHAFAQDAAPKIDSGDTAWMLASSALVLLMTPGLALFYGGMVRRKNVLATIMQSFVLCGLVGVQWVLFGYSLAFAPGSPFIGGLQWMGLNGVGLDPGPYSSTIPHQLFMIYQAMFAIITPALISGAYAERMRFGPYFLFTLLWATLVYDPIAHWVWSADGWLNKMHALDFAGGTVVHISSGVAALAAAMIIGKRKGLGQIEMAPHNLTMTILGTALLWFGWFGFNAGSALAANGLAVNAFVTTNTATAAAALSWMLVEWLHRGKPTALGVASGAVAGLVAITPACGFVSVMAALIIGFAVSFFCYGAIMLKSKLGYDDALDVVGVHAVGGTVGALMTGLFCQKAINSLVANEGLLRGGGMQQLLIQAQAVGVTIVYSFVVSCILLKLVDAIFPLRVSAEDEDTGLDLSQHGELGYNLEVG